MQDDEETEDYTVKEVQARDGTRIKRRRSAEIHNLSERVSKHIYI